MVFKFAGIFSNTQAVFHILQKKACPFFTSAISVSNAVPNDHEILTNVAVYWGRDESTLRGTKGVYTDPEA